MKTINIYLTKEESKQCKLLQTKYRVSLSTLCDKLCFYTFKYLENKEIEQPIFTEYTGKGFKTCVKIKCLLDNQQYLYQFFANTRYKNIYATNCLKIYLAKDIKKYINPEKVSNYYADIDRELQKANDPNWDYNDRLRAMVKMVKNNKEYFRKFIEQ